MRKILLLILLAFSLICFSQSDAGVVIGNWYTAAGACDTLVDSETGVKNEINLCKYSSKTWFATKFTASKAYTCCKIVLPMQKVASPTGNLNAYIYDDDTDAPGSLVGSGSDAVGAATLSTDMGDITFANVSASLSNGVSYWVVITGNWDSSTNYVQINTVDASVEHIMFDSDGVSWEDESTTKSMQYETYE